MKNFEKLKKNFLECNKYYRIIIILFHFYMTSSVHLFKTHHFSKMCMPWETTSCHKDLSNKSNLELFLKKPPSAFE